MLFYILRIFVVYCLSLCFRSPVLQFFQNPPNFFCQNLLTTAVLVAIIQYVVRRQQHIWGFSSAGRALAWHARGHRFDPGNLHQNKSAWQFCRALFVLYRVQAAHRQGGLFYICPQPGILKCIEKVKAIPHNSKCRYGERGAADAVPQPPERCLSRQAGIVRHCLRK